MKDVNRIFEAIHGMYQSVHRNYVSNNDNDLTISDSDKLFVKNQLRQLILTNRESVWNPGLELYVNAINSIDYNAHAEGCGLEDRNITDRYKAMEHGFEKAIEKSIEAVENAV